MDTETLALIITIIGLIITIIGWGIVHLSAIKRDAINKRKEIRIKYLIDAWRLLDEASNRSHNDLNKNIEKAISDIQLFGSKTQIELAQKMAEDISSLGSGESLGLLIDLRKDLRKELDLETVPERFRFLRFK